ncbi:MAG: hypothetical protein IPM13_06370 [Phycisphaerales bacterium]|nr:hypothetical protein [Phycisphaerales bacterium]
MDRSRSSFSMFLVVGALLGLLLTFGPFFIEQLTDRSRLVLMGFGILVLLFFGIIGVITRLYRKASADEAFVLTGMGGRRCVIDGGAIVIPVVHEVIPVSLKTFKLDVDRTGPEALITADFLRADVKAVFYVRVNKEPEDIIQAATSLGMNSGNQQAVQQLIFEKLVSALRTVAATQKLYDLNAKRAEFAEAVQKIVEQDLKPNGLTLESVTISSLDQAPLVAMRPEENVFDAQGARTIAEQVQAQRVIRNQIEREADQRVKEQNVKTSQYVAQQEVLEARAKAEAEAAKNIAQSESQQKAQTVAAEQSKLAGIARVEADREVKLATVEQTKAVEVANQQREQAEQIAAVARERAVELARREQQIAVAEAEKKRAAAEAARLETEQQRKAAEQAVLTVEVRATAERDKDKTVIAKQAQVEQSRIEQQMHADVAAYAEVKKAEAEQTAAQKQAAARITLAEATKQARELEAEAEQAVQMVPVTVAQEQVKVQDAQVSVKIRDLEGQARFEKIARELQVELAKIAADKEARIAAAQAFGQALANANIQLWGDPATFEKMSSAFYRGQAWGTLIDGLDRATPAPIRDAAVAAADAVGSTLGAVAKRVAGDNPEQPKKPGGDGGKA